MQRQKRAFERHETWLQQDFCVNPKTRLLCVFLRDCIQSKVTIFHFLMPDSHQRGPQIRKGLFYLVISRMFVLCVRLCHDTLKPIDLKASPFLMLPFLSSVSRLSCTVNCLRCLFDVETVRTPRGGRGFYLCVK